MNEKPQPVAIEWIDCNSSDGGWYSKEDVEKHDVTKCVDLCFIYKQDDIRTVTYASYNYSEDGIMDYGFLSAIPTSWITKITKL